MHGVEDLINGEIEKRRVGGFASLVGGDGVRAAQDDLFRRIGAVAGRIGGPEKGDSGSAEGDGKMERAGVSTNDADGIAQERHELAEFSIVNEWLRIATGVFDGGSERVFPGTVIDDAANAERVADFLAELAEAISGPTFGAPATARTENEVTCGGVFRQLFANKGFVGRRNAERNIRDRDGCSGAKREFAILVGDVLRAADDAVGVKSGNAELTHRG